MPSANSVAEQASENTSHGIGPENPPALAFSHAHIDFRRVLSFCLIRTLTVATVLLMSTKTKTSRGRLAEHMPRRHPKGIEGPLCLSEQDEPPGKVVDLNGMSCRVKFDNRPIETSKILKIEEAPHITYRINFPPWKMLIGKQDCGQPD